MAKGDSERLERTIDFWRTRRLNRFLFTEISISQLERAAKVATEESSSGLQRIHALILAVSLFESQMRDCLRLAVDWHYSKLDRSSEFLDIKIDAGFFDHMRSRRFTLGEFVFMNTGISTVERLWRAVEFCFPSLRESQFLEFLSEKGDPQYTWQELKSAIARIYFERNRYVHEFLDELAELVEVGEPLEEVASCLQKGLDFLRFIQRTKREWFSNEYREDHPSWGEVGKEINNVQREIDSLLRDIHMCIDDVAKKSKDDVYTESLRSTLNNLVSIAEEYRRARAEFAYTTFGPAGTMRNDIAASVNLTEIRSLEAILKDGLEDIRSHQEW